MAGKLNHFFRAVLARIAFMAISLVGLYFFAQFVQQQMLTMTDTMVERHQQQREAQQAATQARESATAEERDQQQALAASQAKFESDRRRAFDASYEAPAGCDSPRSERQLKECVNHKMRAKRTFFTQYGSDPYGTAAPRNATGLQYGE